MKKLTETNKLLLKAVCLEKGLNGEIDDYGNLTESKTSDEEVSVKTVFGIPIKTTKKAVKSTVIVYSIQEIFGMELGIDYDPNQIAREIILGSLGEKN